MSKYRSEKKMLSPEQLAQAAGEIAEHAENEQAEVALIGGYALQLYGSPRLTGDVDVVVDRSIEGLPPESDLSFGGYRSRTDGGVPVDVVLWSHRRSRSIRPTSWERERMQRAIDSIERILNRLREADRHESAYGSMKREQFRIGLVFYTGSGAWVCTDIGTRVIVAVEEHLLRERPNGPPYEWVEHVFDEYDQQGCSTLPFGSEIK